MDLTRAYGPHRHSGNHGAGVCASGMESCNGAEFPEQPQKVITPGYMQTRNDCCTETRNDCCTLPPSQAQAQSMLNPKQEVNLKCSCSNHTVEDLKQKLEVAEQEIEAEKKTLEVAEQKLEDLKQKLEVAEQEIEALKRQLQKQQQHGQ
ncbi:hypothetical protein VOLCADRAFT_105447 [Volvox carteri f. nagariensis]|uniref:Uncharacterized protein n=1 Tax=Volvox carteri f. nagariensis TaxID=3068 RepID=D8U0U9_VOLCA|nr:uncharacterized protein VOLCADRAFT_105447 [Volvox carteri f. nagariensis]EFJ46702.1 hypothetical protein VOLCADRAFT_105447 [Volvox carteri f. nagariensis]|eukprot:XP_002952231.1 hypothetical protein VOLCADRAFT_105447 [Volvox carteri f. nagariensis]